MRNLLAACLIAGSSMATAQHAPPPRPQSSAPSKRPPSQVQSPSYDGLIAKALSLLAGKNAKESVAVSEQAIALDEKRWEAYATAASAYSAQQLYDDTISMLQMALGRAPEEKKQAVRDAITAARRQLAAEVASKPAESTGIRSEPVPAQAATAPGEVVLWKSIDNSNRSEDYRGYLATYPNGLYSGLAKSRLEALDWKAVESTENQSDLRNYLHNHSDGPHALAASGLLQKLLWTSIEKSTSPADFRAFIQEFPNGSYSRLAANRLDELDWLAVSNQGAADVKSYIDTHPNGQNLSAARTRYAELTKEETERQKKLEEAKVLTEEKGLTFVWKHDHRGYDGPVGKLHIEKNLITWNEDATQMSAKTDHNFSLTCSEVKWERHVYPDLIKIEPAIDFLVRGQRVRLMGHGEAEAFLEALKKYCPY